LNPSNITIYAEVVYSQNGSRKKQMELRAMHIDYDRRAIIIIIIIIIIP